MIHVGRYIGDRGTFIRTFGSYKVNSEMLDYVSNSDLESWDVGYLMYLVEFIRKSGIDVHPKRNYVPFIEDLYKGFYDDSLVVFGSYRDFRRFYLISMDYFSGDHIPSKEGWDFLVSL